MYEAVDASPIPAHQGFRKDSQLGTSNAVSNAASNEFMYEAQGGDGNVVTAVQYVQ